jgi:hypothetical protein
LRSELYSVITLAFGQQVVPGNHLLLRPDRVTRIPANAEPRSEGMQLILSVSRQAEQRRRRGRPAHEEPTPISPFIHVHSHGTLRSVTLPMAKDHPDCDTTEPPAALPRTWPAHYGRVPRAAINSHRSLPAQPADMKPARAFNAGSNAYDTRAAQN